MNVPLDPLGDGIDHINIYSKGHTALGCDLSNFAPLAVVVPEGRFASIEAYWYWLGVQEPHGEPLRHLSGKRAKQVGRELRDAHPAPPRADFEEKIKFAMAAKLVQHEDLAFWLRESSLPLTHYYYYGTPGTAKVVDAGYAWITDHWTALREALKLI